MDDFPAPIERQVVQVGPKPEPQVAPKFESRAVNIMPIQSPATEMNRSKQDAVNENK